MTVTETPGTPTNLGPCDCCGGAFNCYHSMAEGYLSFTVPEGCSSAYCLPGDFTLELIPVGGGMGGMRICAGGFFLDIELTCTAGGAFIRMRAFAPVFGGGTLLVWDATWTASIGGGNTWSPLYIDFGTPNYVFPGVGTPACVADITVILTA